MIGTRYIKLMAVAAFAVISSLASAQKYPDGIVDKTIAVIGNEVITISGLEEEVQMMQAYGMGSDRNARCEILEQMMELVQKPLVALALN